MKKIFRIFNTIRYLKLIQVYYRIISVIRNNNKIKIKEYKYNYTFLNKSYFLGKKYLINSLEFNFLNRRKDFKNIDAIDWNFLEFGKLWNYNLRYFEYLNGPEMNQKDGLALINSFYRFILSENRYLIEPYPTSLRIINWIKFISKYRIKNENIVNFLYFQVKFLKKNIEYHLMANHLLENAIALLFASYFFNDNRIYRKSKKIIFKQLDEQILDDGCHFELSTMYHLIVYGRLLECIDLIQYNNHFEDNSFLNFIRKKASQMLSFINKVKYSDNSYPLLNDAAYNISLSVDELINYSKWLKIEQIDIPLSKSGYRKFINNKLELIIDCGKIGPEYNPGHGHADIFNFELYYKGLPIIVDTGTSTYENNEIRKNERSTFSHNTVIINNKEQSEIWNSFRVGKRAKVKIISDDSYYLEGIINNYGGIKKLSHNRSFSIKKNVIIIKDICSGKNISSRALYHFHPKREITLEVDNTIIVDNILTIKFSENCKVEKRCFFYAPEFNKRIKSNMISVSFNNILETKINL